MSFVDKLKKVLRVKDVLADPYRATMAAMMPFFQAAGGFSQEEIASTVLRMLLRARGNPNRFWLHHYGYQARLQQNTLYPSPDTIAAAMIAPPSKKGSFIKHNLQEQDRRHGEVFLAQFSRYCEDLGVKDGDYYITLDGSPTVKYGPKAYESDRPLEDHTEASLFARPIFRRKGDAVHPFFRGSTGGHSFLHAAAHHLATNDSSTLFIDVTEKMSLLKAVRSCMANLAKAPRKPAYIVVDKEFTHDGGVWEELRNYADKRDVLVVGPMARIQWVQGDLERIWHDRLYKETRYAGHRVWWAYQECAWSKSAKGYRPYGMLIAFEEVPLGFLPDDRHGCIVNEGEKGVSPRVAAFPIQVNKRITTNQEFIGVLGCIPRRWACEALFGRHEMRFAQSRGRDMLPRQLFYELAFGALNSYAYWRGVKRLQVPRAGPDGLSMSWWMGDLEACMDFPELIGLRPKLLRPRRARKDHDYTE